MSLASLNLTASANQGAVMTVLHPVDRVPLKQANGDPVTITLLGRDSDAFIRAERRNRKIARDALLKRQPYSPADDDRAGDQLLADCTVAWSGIPAGWLSEGGEDETPAPFSPEAALKLFANPGVRWLRDQADEFVGDRGNALKSAPKA